VNKYILNIGGKLILYPHSGMTNLNIGLSVWHSSSCKW